MNNLSPIQPGVRKIVGIISFMNSAGAQEAMLRLMRQLRLRGYDTEVWFLYEKSPCYRGEPGVRVVLGKAGLSASDIPRLFARLVRMLRQSRPDVVVGFLPLGNIMGLLAAAAAGIPLRIASQRSPGPTFSRIMRLLDRQLGVRGVYNRVVCVSQAVMQSFEDYPPAYRNRLCVVNNGIEWSPSTLEKAMALASDLNAQDRIHFLGSISHSRVMDLLRAADGFIQTSLFEGQSNSILEAMHEGLPIVCSDIPMQRETLCEADGEDAGLLVPLEEFDAWREALIRVRDDGALAAGLGARARALVKRRFTLDRMIDGFETAILDGEVAQCIPVGGSCAIEGAELTH